MHDKVSVVDRFRFWLSSRILFRAQNLLLCKNLLFLDQISGGGGLEVSEGVIPVEESQASESIM